MSYAQNEKEEVVFRCMALPESDLKERSND